MQRATSRVSDPEPFSLRSIAVPVFGPSLLFGLGEGAILPVVALSVRDLGGSAALAALVVTLIGIGSLVSNLPASLLTIRYGERWAIVGAGVWCALAMSICMFVSHLAAFAIGVFMIGMASAVFALARQSYLTEAVPFHYRARALSTLGGVMRIGLFIGPFLGAALIPFAGLAGAYWHRRGGAGAVVAARGPHARPAGRAAGRSTAPQPPARPARRAADAARRSRPATRRSSSPSASAPSSSARCAPRARRWCRSGPTTSASMPRPPR